MINCAYPGKVVRRNFNLVYFVNINVLLLLHNQYQSICIWTEPNQRKTFDNFINIPNVVIHRNINWCLTLPVAVFTNYLFSNLILQNILPKLDQAKRFSQRSILTKEQSIFSWKLTGAAGRVKLQQRVGQKYIAC